MDLTLVIVNFDTKDLTRECVKSINKYTEEIKYEIKLIDNASKDGSVKHLKEYFKYRKNIKIIENEKNLGFSKANNKGIKESRGRYVLLVNSDTVFNDNILKEMVGWLDEEKAVGVATCSLKNMDGTYQGTGGYFPTMFRIFAWMFFLDDLPIVDRLIKPFHPMHEKSPFYKGEGFYLKKRQVDWVTGAFMIIRKEVIDKIGMLDEDYFMYTEDVDFCYRAKRAGWRILYNPGWSIMHLGGASSHSGFPILQEFQGLKIYYKKHMSAWKTPILRFLLKCGAFMRMVIFGVTRGKEYGKIYAQAFWQA